jgi:hypothetical protein
MIENIIQSLTSPNSIANMVVIMLALFAKDLTIALLRAAADRILSDKNKKNDHLADVANAVADSLEKVTPIKPRGK